MYHLVLLSTSLALLGLARGAEREPWAPEEFAVDDACLADGDSGLPQEACALSALQRQGRRKQANAAPDPPVSSASAPAAATAAAPAATPAATSAGTVAAPLAAGPADAPAAGPAAAPESTPLAASPDGASAPGGGEAETVSAELEGGPCISSPAVNCVGTPGACCGGMVCYAKHAAWGSCMPAGSCRPGIHYEEMAWYWTPWSCQPLSPVAAPRAASGPTPAPAPGSCGATSCFKNTGTCYSLNWKAEGDSFFDDWDFVTEDLGNHGPVEYVSREEAFNEGIAQTSSKGSFLRVGARDDKKGKRTSLNLHSKYAWSPADSFIVAMRYQHVPGGCGVWPAFWTVNTDLPWPEGTELDILEYANMMPQASSLHTSANHTCALDDSQISKCMYQRTVDEGQVDWNCATDYYKNWMGCAPNKLQRMGAAWINSNPGVIAAEWTPHFIKVFYIPEAEIPSDLLNDAPRPATWDRYIISYMPWSEATCPGAMKFMRPQEIVMDIALCGDFAGQKWDMANMCPMATGLGTWTGCKIDVWDKENDCCNKFILSPGSDSTVINDAFFQVSWLKVFTPQGTPPPSRTSGTHRRGGRPLETR